MQALSDSEHDLRPAGPESLKKKNKKKKNKKNNRNGFESVNDSSAGMLPPILMAAEAASSISQVCPSSACVYYALLVEASVQAALVCLSALHVSWPACHIKPACSHTSQQTILTNHGSSLVHITAAYFYIHYSSLYSKSQQPTLIHHSSLHSHTAAACSEVIAAYTSEQFCFFNVRTQRCCRTCCRQLCTAATGF